MKLMNLSFVFFDSVRGYLQQRKVSRAAVFGSFARGEENIHSDIDLLIEKEGLTFFEVLQMEEDLEKLTHRKIDIVEFGAVKTSLKSYIFKDLIKLI